MKEQYTIFCADDDEENLRFYRKLLERRGYRAECYRNGQELLEAVAQEIPDLILLEAKMPVLDGLAVAERLRRRPEMFHVPIIFVSAHTNEEDILYCLSTGGTDFICKPVNPSELVAKVTMAIRRYFEQIDNIGGLPVGTRVAGRYEIINLIDSGGFSNVYRAIDIASRKPDVYAIKVFNFPYTMHANRQLLFTILREVYQLCKLDHPCIVKVRDFGQYGGIIYIVLEYIDGRALDGLVAEKGKLCEANAAFVGFEVARVLGYLDGKDILHRDIKPDNIMITRDGDVKLVDFGLAKQRREQTLSIKKDEFQGSAHFVSPEYIEGKPTDIESDIYSLGTALYYVATGKKPFDGKDLTNILFRQVHEVPPTVRSVCPELSQEFSDLIDAMLAKRPEARPKIADVIHRFGVILGRQHVDTESSSAGLKSAVGEETGDIRLPKR